VDLLAGVGRRRKEETRELTCEQCVRKPKGEQKRSPSFANNT